MTERIELDKHTEKYAGFRQETQVVTVDGLPYVRLGAVLSLLAAANKDTGHYGFRRRHWFSRAGKWDESWVVGYLEAHSARDLVSEVFTVATPRQRASSDPKPNKET